MLSACNDPWEDRFNGNIQEGQTIWELLSSNPEYSDFVNLLKETGYDTILNRNTVFTVFVPERSSLQSVLSLDQEEKTTVTGFHLSNSIIYSPDIDNITPLKTLCGKQLFLSKKGNEIYLNQDTRITKADIRASNGVIHEIEKVQQLKPNLLEILESDETLSQISDFILEDSYLVFDRENSLQIGIDSIGQTVYDSVWISTNDFFTQYADLSSEDNAYTLFLAENILLDTSMNGEYKQGYLVTLSKYIINGIQQEDEIEEVLFSVTGIPLTLTTDQYRFYANASNGVIYKLTDLEGTGIPITRTWEFTDISDFDSIRNVRNTDYLEYFDLLQELNVKNLSGGFTEFRYEIKTGTLNKDYLKIGTVSGTDVNLEFNLSDILPGKYFISVNASIRAADGIKYNAYLNDRLLAAGLNFNGGTYAFELREIGMVEIRQASGNTFTIEIDGSSSLNTKCYIDYLLFEPVK